MAKKVEQDPTAAGFMGPAFIDTYANLLYKAGETGEAVLWEEKAVKLTAKGSFWWDAHTGALAKMKGGLGGSRRKFDRVLKKVRARGEDPVEGDEF